MVGALWENWSAPIFRWPNQLDMLSLVMSLTAKISAAIGLLAVYGLAVYVMVLVWKQTGGDPFPVILTAVVLFFWAFGMTAGILIAASRYAKPSSDSNT